jgi:ankyrin repeat protein
MVARPLGPGDQARYADAIDAESELEMSRHLDKELFNATRDASASLAEAAALIEQGADPNRRGKCGSTPLEKAASNGHVEIARLLLGAGADHSIRSDDDSTPIYWAAANGHLEIVSMLLDHGADPNSYRDQGQSPLFHAISHGHVGVVRLLLESGANPDYDYRGSTAVDYAQRYGDAEMLRVVQNTRWSPKNDRKSDPE